jgi:hypothetical protein
LKEAVQPFVPVAVSGNTKAFNLSNLIIHITRKLLRGEHFCKEVRPLFWRFLSVTEAEVAVWKDAAEIWSSHWRYWPEGCWREWFQHFTQVVAVTLDVNGSGCEQAAGVLASSMVGAGVA